MIFIQYIEAQFIDQGGPCGHSDPYTGADDCLCRDGIYIPAYFTEATTDDYCNSRDYWDHVEDCPKFVACPF